MSDVYFCGDDYLGLGTYGNNIRTIIENSGNIVRSNDNKSFVIGIDAPWGTGKTYFLKMLESYLCGDWKKPDLTKKEITKAENRTGFKCDNIYKNKKRVIYYDAWSNDFWNNAFEPFYETIINNIAGYCGAGKEDVLSAARRLGKVISIGFDAYMNNKIGDAYEIAKKSLETLGEEGKAILEGNYDTDIVFPEYAAFRNAIQGLKVLLKKVVEQLKKDHTDDCMIVILVDELDRCKPLFAVQTLEIVKHFFNIPGLVFVFTLDISQLKYCVKNVYGNDFDAEGYLERFFNYLSHLPQGNYRPVIELFNEEAQEKAPLWDPFSGAEVSTYVEIAKRFHLSLRELKVVLSSLHLLEQITLKKNTEHPYSRIIFFFFLSYKYKEPEGYKQSFLKGDLDKIGELLLSPDTQIPFHVYDIENQVASVNNDLTKNKTLSSVLTSEKKMCDLEIEVCDCFSAGEIKKGRFATHDANGHIWGSSIDHTLCYAETVGYLLYLPDFEDDSVTPSEVGPIEEQASHLPNSFNVFQMTPIEFLNKKMEMIGFLNVPIQNTP